MTKAFEKIKAGMVDAIALVEARERAVRFGMSNLDAHNPFAKTVFYPEGRTWVEVCAEILEVLKPFAEGRANCHDVPDTHWVGSGIKAGHLRCARDLYLKLGGQL